MRTSGVRNRFPAIIIRKDDKLLEFYNKRKVHLLSIVHRRTTKMSRRSGRMSSVQKNKLSDMMSNNPRIVHGRIDNEFAKKDLDGMWVNIKETLHNLPGSRKEVAGWKKVSVRQIF